MIKNIILNTIFYLVIAFILIISQVFIFWFIFGEGAESGRILDLWYVNLILEYLPLVIITTILSFRTFWRYKKNELDKVKSNLISLLILILLYLLRYQLIDLFR